MKLHCTKLDTCAGENKANYNLEKAVPFCAQEVSFNIYYLTEFVNEAVLWVYWLIIIIIIISFLGRIKSLAI